MVRPRKYSIGAASALNAPFIMPLSGGLTLADMRVDIHDAGDCLGRRC